MRRHVTVIMVAGGKGLRMSSSTPKQYMFLCGKPIIAHSIEKFDKCDLVDDIIIVVSAEQTEYFRKDILESESFTKVRSIIEGGAERQQSVYNGLLAADSNTEIILVHDAVRPLINIIDIERTIQGATEHGNCTLGVLVKDTIKTADEHNIVIGTPERKNLYSIQTPQGFWYGSLLDAHKEALREGFLGTDDCTLVERLGIKTKIIDGSYSNIKITTKEDLVYAKALIQDGENAFRKEKSI